MNRISLFFLLLAVVLLPSLCLAGPDDYIGDTAIYGGETATVKPNVLILFDTSGSMDGKVDVEICVPDPDYDDDGIDDDADNCPVDANADQTDTDGDGLGDVCDPDPGVNPPPDSDGDGIADDTDNCVVTANADQADTDGDGVGDACEPPEGISGDYDPAYDYLTDDENCETGGWWSSDTDCQLNAVYQCTDWRWRSNTCAAWVKILDDTDDVSDSGQCGSIENKLEKNGHWTGNRRLVGWNGSPICEKSRSTRYYATGNWINWYQLTSGGTTSTMSAEGEELYAQSLGDAAESASTSAGGMICNTEERRKLDIARDVVSDLIESTSGVNFGLIRFNNGDEGGRFQTQSVSGSNYTTYIKDMEDIHTGTMTNEEALLEVVADLPAEDWTPLAETLYESMRYFGGNSSAFTNSLTYTSPINAGCQQNYVIIITDGMSTQDRDSVLRTICDDGDCDGDDNEPGSFSNDGSDYLDDVAKYLFATDFSTGDAGYAGTQNVITYTIGFGLDGANQDAVDLLEDAAVNGGGEAYLAANYQTLIGALTSIIGQILETNSAFVAPVVPTSPENKTYSGKRVYIGFFKPIQNSDWQGNLKKFGINAEGYIVDKNGDVATDVNGNFLVTSESYWSDNADGANVDEGGLGGVLVARDPATRPRLIYTRTGTNNDLTAAENRFAVGNAALTPASMIMTPADQIDLINYVHGLDPYDDNVNGDTTERRQWILGDILHSRPVIYPYETYSLEDEDDANENKTVIFAGSNDGQLHAFRDVDGEELWSFIPPSLLPNLRFLHNNIHNYFVDGSPTLYTYDHNKDGNIDSSDGSLDKVILMMGLRRGGGIDTLDSSLPRGSYFALDVTNQNAPKFLWEFDSTNSDFSELGETWAKPFLGKVRVNGQTKIVAIFGAGYDNNEDLRFGNTQGFPDTTTPTTETTLLASDAGDVASPGSSAQVNPKGRGIYILELASLNSSGVPTVHASPTKLWEYVYDSGRASNNPTYSIPSDVAAYDSDYDGFLDKVYVGDTGGQMWRFDIGNKVSTNNWSGTKIFAANPSDASVSEETPATNGRKILYAPSVVLENGYTGVYFGTGDRAHPLNQGTTDRLYAVYDRPGRTAPITEAEMVNVTENNLQAANPDPDPDVCSDTDPPNQSVKCLLERLYSSDYYGWFIKLDETPGEKALAPAVAFNKVVYYTTYSPNVTTVDPCLSGNLGIGTIYSVDYKTGEAVFNNDLTNDNQYEGNTNVRAGVPNSAGDGGVILRRSDRPDILGSGIPSGVVVLITEDGSSTITGCGGGLCTGDTTAGGRMLPVYWLME